MAKKQTFNIRGTSRMFVAVLAGMSVLLTPITAEAATPKKPTTAAAQMVAELNKLQLRYEKAAELYQRRSERMEDPAPYLKAAEQLTLLAARTGALKTEAQKVRTTSALSSVRKKKIKLHTTASTLYRSLLALSPNSK
jgi:hypothetical protein